MKSVVQILAAVFTLLLLMMTPVARSQGGATGAIAGTVVDTSGSSIAAADVQIISSSTQSVVRRLTTNTDGEFVAPATAL